MEIAVSAALGFLLGYAADLLFVGLYTDTPLGGTLHRCNDCRSPIRRIFAVPLAGYLLCRGRCPDCGAALPLRALVLPLGSAGLFVISYIVFDDLGVGLLGGFFATVFLTLTLTDLDRRLLPNRIVYPSILLAIALCWAWPDASSVEVLAGGLVGLVIAGGLLLFSLPFGSGAFGMGDVKMIILIGFVTGFPGVIVAIFVGTIAAAIVSLVLVVTRIRGMRDYIPHGPFLALGAVIALFAGS